MKLNLKNYDLVVKEMTENPKFYPDWKALWDSGSRGGRIFGFQGKLLEQWRNMLNDSIPSEADTPRAFNKMAKQNVIDFFNQVMKGRHADVMEMKEVIRTNRIAYKVAKEYMIARRVAYKDPNRITIKDRRDYVKYMLANNEGWALRAIQKIFERQTFDEQQSEATHHLNQMGFTGVDAEFLSSVAKQFSKYNRLSPKQMYFVKKKMPKYWMQIIEIADKPKLDAQVLNWKQQQTPDLFPKEAGNV